MGRRVLILDLDPQGNASTGLGVARARRQVTSQDVLLDPTAFASAIIPTQTANLSLVPATPDLSSIDLELATVPGRTRRLRSALAHGDVGRFDYILMDCPPALNLLTVNALVAADGVLVPLQCEFFALEGISQLLRTIAEVRESSNSGLITQGIVLTMYDRRNRLTSDVEADVRETLGKLVYQTVIPRNVRLSEAPSHGIPALQYDSLSSGSRAYRALAQEFTARMAPKPSPEPAA